jgi:integrase
MTASLLNFPLRKTRTAPRKIALTEQRAADLKPHSSTFYMNDARVPGLSVRTTKAGVKSYVFTKKFNGKLLRITLGKAAGMTLVAARKAAEAYNGELAKGVDVAAARRANKALARSNATTLADAYERFLTLKDRRPSTIRDYNMVWRLYVPDNMKRRRVTEITSSDVEKLKTVIGRTAKRTANKVVILLSAIFSKSGRWADNPARGVARFEERVRTQRLNDNELARLWNALEADNGSLWSDFFKILILTGARRGALCGGRISTLAQEYG